MVGSRAEIQCGNVPGVNYTWRGPTNEISTDPLIISPVSVSDDESTYKCIANIPSNIMYCQTEEESIVVNVIGKYEVVKCMNEFLLLMVLYSMHRCFTKYLFFTNISSHLVEKESNHLILFENGSLIEVLRIGYILIIYHLKNTIICYSGN